MTSPALGDRLYQIVTNTEGGIFKLGELVQLTYEAFEYIAKGINQSTETTITLKYPIGQHASGQPMFGESSYEKPDLIQHYAHLAHAELPLTAMYHLVTSIETMLMDILREVILAYPKKLSGKRTIPLSLVLSSESIDSVRLLAVDSLLHELSYKSPRDFAQSIQEIIDVNLLEIPAFHRYIEVKATRDIYIHNRGVTNDVYVDKAGSHARVKIGETLPIDNNYFLSASESCIQVAETLREELHKHWPSLEYVTSKQGNTTGTEEEPS